MRNPVLRALLLIVFLLCGSAHAQDFPAHALRLVVPYPAGGLIDRQARLLATPMGASLRQELRLENVPGAAGTIGLQRLLAAPSDGHELAISSDSDVVLAPLVSSEVRYRPEQFRLLGVIGQAPMVLVSAPASRVRDLRRWLQEARADRSRNWTIGNYGLGSNAHLCADDFARRSGIGLVHVPYKGIAPLLQDLMGGHVDLAFMPLAGPVLESIAAGKLLGLGVATRARDARLAEMPTLDEAAGTSGFVHASWSGLVVPASVPEAAAQRLHRSLRESLRDAAVQAELLRLGVQAAPDFELAQAQAFLAGEVQRYRELAEAWRARDPAALR